MPGENVQLHSITSSKGVHLTARLNFLNKALIKRQERKSSQIFTLCMLVPRGLTAN